MATKKDDEPNARKPAFKADLDVKIIKGFSLAKVSTGYGPEGKLVFAPNPLRDKDGKAMGLAATSYIIWDGNQSAPPGFGVRIAAKKTYISLCKIFNHSAVACNGAELTSIGGRDPVISFFSVGSVLAFDWVVESAVEGASLVAASGGAQH